VDRAIGLCVDLTAAARTAVMRGLRGVRLPVTTALLVIGVVVGSGLLTTLGLILALVGLVLNFVPLGGTSRRVW